MASIQILNLYPAGSDLFSDSESFMTELVDNRIGTINGGRTHPTLFSPLCHPILHSWRCCDEFLPPPSVPI